MLAVSHLPVISCSEPDANPIDETSSSAFRGDDLQSGHIDQLSAPFFGTTQQPPSIVPDLGTRRSPGFIVSHR